MRFLIFPDKLEEVHSFHSDSSDLEFDFPDDELTETVSESPDVQGIEIFLHGIVVSEFTCNKLHRSAKIRLIPSINLDMGINTSELCF